MSLLRSRGETTLRARPGKSHGYECAGCCPGCELRRVTSGLYPVVPDKSVKRFAHLREALFRATETSLASFWETYTSNVDRINALSALSRPQKVEQLKVMYERTARAVLDTQMAYDEILAELKREVVSVVKEVRGA